MAKRRGKGDERSEMKRVDVIVLNLMVGIDNTEKAREE